MTSAVVDASVTAPFILADEAGDLSDRLLAVLTEGQAIVPQHWRLEIANLGLTAVRRSRITFAELENGLKLLDEFQIVLDPDTDRSAWRRTLGLAALHDLTSYDAAYLDLAKRRSLQLATRDGNLVRAAEREGVLLFPL
ncbi:MAG TPA: type II toxin-antitoxin system VapC family toxin [Sphingomicrobium sp.]